ncbi:MAG: fumarate hydratase, partial [Firmicutes bacterium]|nr:fumarate hydratase [Bacillota bacterium]
MRVRTVKAEAISAAVGRLCREANTVLGDDVIEAIGRARAIEKSPRGLDILDKLLENAAVARSDNIPVCQDTGVAVVFLEVGQDVRIDGNLEEAVNEGVRRGYVEG